MDHGRVIRTLSKKSLNFMKWLIKQAKPTHVTVDKNGTVTAYWKKEI